MLGAILGDIIGSPYEGGHRRSVATKDFPLFSPDSRFTDDSVLTCATAKALVRPSFLPYKLRFAHEYKDWALRYPNRGYGSKFKEWIKNSKFLINNSYANGCMMRCSPIAMYSTSLEQARKWALESIKMTHNSPESERGVQSIVSAIYMAKTGCSKTDIKKYVEEQFGHMLDLTVEEWRNKAKPTIRCNVTGPQALVCFMESTDYKSAIKNAIYTRGDTDTIAAIAGSIAEAFYGVESIPQNLIDGMKARLTPEMITLINRFHEEISKTLPQYKGIKL